MIHTRGVESSSLPLAIILGNPYKTGCLFYCLLGISYRKWAFAENTASRIDVRAGVVSFPGACRRLEKLQNYIF